MKQHKYERRGLLAFDPRAVFDLFFEPPARNNVAQGDVEVVGIVGPLEHHAGFWCDSYDGVLERVSAALAGNARTVVLKIDSPGGLVSGAFETARALRAKAKAAGKSLVAYVDGSACSAAYALACAADRIVASETSVVGSIGVIDMRVDATAYDAAQGIRYAFVTSGTHKADGNPHTPMSAAELVEKQALVDDVAAVFFALVKDMRGVDAAPLEARVFVGAAAKAAGLVDEIQPFSDLLAALASPATGATMSKYSEARAALEEAAKGDDEEAKRAQRALAAMDEDEDEPADGEGSEAAAEGEEEPDGDEDKSEEEPEASAGAAASAPVSAATVAALAAQIAKLEAKGQKTEAEQRAALLKGQPEALAKALAKAPLAEVKAVLAALPKAPKAKAPAANAASATPAATRGGPAGPSSSAPHAKEMAARMGLTRTVMGVRRDGNFMVFGAMEGDTAQGAGKDGAK